MSAAFLNEAEDNFTGRNYASLFYLQEKFGQMYDNSYPFYIELYIPCSSKMHIFNITA
jgi:hypothetical protein